MHSFGRALLSACLLLAPHSARAASAPPLVFDAPPELAHVKAAFDAAPAPDLDDIARLVGLAEPGPAIRVFLAPDGSPATRVAPEWAAGYVLGGSDTVVLITRRAGSYPDRSLEGLLRHEVAHVLIGRAAAGRGLPRWFDEGLAMLAAREWQLGDRTRASLGLLTRGRLPLAQLDEGFEHGSGNAELAYALSGALVRDIEARFGRDAPARILAATAAGLPFEAAFEAASGVTLGGWLDSFWRRELLWSRWVPVLTSSVTLWLGITLLMLVAAKRRRDRDRRIEQHWEAVGLGGDRAPAPAPAPMAAPAAEDHETVH